MYHNTTHSTGIEVSKFRTKAKSQEEAIARFFRREHAFNFTASEVINNCIRNGSIDPVVPMTSIRRAMTNLTADNVLYKTHIQRKGPYGRPEYAYKLVDQQLDMFR